MDLHTHTLASAHGYSTLRENVTAAKAKGLEILGTTDHSKAMSGVYTNAFFTNYNAIPRVLDGVTVLCGVEANITDYRGAIDIDPLHRPLDYVIVSLHRPCILPGSTLENTRAVVGAMDHPKVAIVGHPDDMRYPLDYQVLAREIVDRGLFCEVNNTSLKAHGPRKGARENLLKLLAIGGELGMEVVVNSDAHMDVSVGELDLALSLLEEIQYPRELILNMGERAQILGRFDLAEK
ncbi:MAG: PHP domain-containing protein [Tissierellia bacterium]|nr:PHP domain-containing protein [Tissierellia bacterium]